MTGITLEEAQRESWRANSYTRLQTVFDLRPYMLPTAWFALLGSEWDTCDNIGHHVRRIRPLLQRATDAELAAMMTADEREALAGLPDTLTVYRGCGRANRKGLSWSLDRKVAAKFPQLLRYRVVGDPLLITGITSKHRAVLKLDRNEVEIISTDVVALCTDTLPFEEVAT